MHLRQLLAEGRRVQLDGGLSTALEELGADLDDPLWTARILRDEPSLVLAAHRAFVAAGAEIVISASYQAPDELLAESVRVARRAGVLVAGSVAPYGASLAGGQEYTGDYEVPAGWHERRLALLLEGEPDFLAIETQPRADEAAAIVSLLEDIDCWVTFTCSDGERTGHGEPIEEAVQAVLARQVAAVGVNCTAPEHVDELLARIRSVTDLPLVAYPNAGRVYDASTKTWRGGASSWSGNAAIVGGCCGVGPAALTS
ncbi:homocysteine S-methyltransferase [Solirubrobacter ginsenosidimutans]|uniref:Homocysteine S-methyltransferase n=1 Tax=Solirubrobacter ginsenosidimutans TaxID=490573 RepID=A0A9X3S5E5_9ACTN|nr:homocysteine S-methyltransferase [Solirubrobacter ginsenosidimutans]MDA0165542.1 homocysteine S-methyltransferase [Solirubrobacter ginsenosidimutans]